MVAVRSHLWFADRVREAVEFYTSVVPDSAIERFMGHCSNRLGNDFFRTPRTTITSFINLLAVLEQNPGADWQQMLGEVAVVKDTGGMADLAADPDDELASFTL